jgi:hypothetical protein
MFKPYPQILLTYLTNWRRVPWQFGMLLLGLYIVAHAKDGLTAYTGTLGFFILSLAFIVGSLKQQITLPQASLIPHYRVPHLVVAGVLLLPWLVLPPLVASWPHMDTEPAFRLQLRPPNPGNIPPTTLPSYDVIPVPPVPHSIPYFPILTLHLLLCACTAWAVYRHSGLFIVLGIAIYAASQAPPVHQWLLQFVATPFSVTAVILFCGVLISFAALARCFLLLNEEMPAYHRANTFGSNPKPVRSQMPSLSTSPDYSSRWQQFLSAPKDYRINALSYVENPSLRQRIYRWRATTSNTQGMWIIGLLICIPALVVSMRLDNDIFLVIPLLWLFPAPLMLGVCYRRTLLFGLQSLYPVSRSTFLTDQAFTIAWEWAQVWLTMAACVFAAFSLPTGKPLSEIVLLQIAVAGAVQCLIFASALWILHLHFHFPKMLLAGLAGGVAFPAEMAISFLGPATLVVLAIVCLAVAAFILYDAYRGWMTADLA